MFNINEKLFMLRKQHGMTQQELADKLGISQQSYSRYERNDIVPPRYVIDKLGEVYQISSDEFYTNDFTNLPQTQKQYCFSELLGYISQHSSLEDMQLILKYAKFLAESKEDK